MIKLAVGLDFDAVTSKRREQNRTSSQCLYYPVSIIGPQMDARWWKRGSQMLFDFKISH